jgi:putative PIN family toxin of toxin-antitoxin system
VRIVLDTNVLVSAFLKPGSHPAQVLEMILAGEVSVLVDARILVEYHEVLSQPKFDLPERPKIEVLEYLTREGENVVAEPSNEAGPDPDDLPFLEPRSPAALSPWLLATKSTSRARTDLT